MTFWGRGASKNRISQGFENNLNSTNLSPWRQAILEFLERLTHFSTPQPPSRHCEAVTIMPAETIHPLKYENLAHPTTPKTKKYLHISHNPQSKIFKITKSWIPSHTHRMTHDNKSPFPTGVSFSLTRQHLLPLPKRVWGKVSSSKWLQFQRSSIQKNCATNKPQNRNHLFPQYLNSLLPSKRPAFTMAEGALHVDISENTRWSALTMVAGATHVDISKNTRQCAFTMAEVLITLGIIGIIAAMTLPSLINNQKNKVLQAALKKAYSRHSEALLLVKAEAGVDNLYNEFMVYNLNAVGHYNYYYRAQEFTSMYKNKLNVIGACKYTKPPRTYTNNKEADVSIGGVTKPSWLLSDGTCAEIMINGGRVGLTVDVNGAGKGPNRFGHDIFVFWVNTKGVLEPLKMSKLYSKEEQDDFTSSKGEPVGDDWKGQLGAPCSIKSEQAGNGMGCTWYALNDVNPDDNSARYWENLPK